MLLRLIKAGSKEKILVSMSRRSFLNLLGSLMGGWLMAMPKSRSMDSMARLLVQLGDWNESRDLDRVEYVHTHENEADRLLEKIGYFNDVSPKSFVFDEHKYSSPKRKLEPSEWGTTNRHLPIELNPEVINKPGERSPQALKQALAYVPFDSPRYVAAPGERATMCNIAAWDWSRALSLHLPHWIGTTEMSANMLYRWISHSQAGGVYGEGWQPVKVSAARLLAARGIPVFALAENPRKGRHGHVALVYPGNPTTRGDDTGSEFYLASVSNGRSRGGNGVKSLGNTFRWLTPTFFVHKIDFIVYQDS